MKKATIVITIISILVSATTYFIIINTNEIMQEITLNESITNSIDVTFKSIESSIDDADDDYKYYYQDIELNQKQIIEVNECIQFYLEDESFENANNCQEKIVDAILKERGELNFIKSITGDMLSYTKNGVFIKYNYLKDLIGSGKSKNDLKEKLMLVFINRYRDPLNLETTYQNYKATFFNYISKDVYDKVYKAYINSFLKSYNEIHNREDVEAFYQDIYFKAEKLNKHNDYWFYTFWKRRELEKNDIVIYTILKEIEDYYTYNKTMN